MSNVQTATFQVGAAPVPAPMESQPAADKPPPVSYGHQTLRLSAKERLALLDQLAILLDSGIQIPAALQSMRVESREPRLAAVLLHLEQAIANGVTLHDATAAAPKAFPSIVSQMLRAGEASGQMPEIMRRTVEMLEADAQVRAKLRSAMLYPSVMIILTIGVVVFLLTVIVPKFEKLFRSREATLPSPTRALMAIGDFATSYGLWIAIGVAAATVAFAGYVRTVQGRRRVDRIVLGLPIVGVVYRTSVLTRCARTLGLLLRSGVPAHVALEHTRDVASSPVYADFWAAARLHVLNGGALADAVRSPLVPHTFHQIVAAGEATAHLDRTLLKTADQYTRDLERRIKDLVTLVEPAMVVSMGAVVGFVALSIMLPIFQLSKT